MPDNGLERYRSALLLLAHAQLARHQQLGLEASDLVQQTFVEAYRDLKQFHGSTAAERFAWLRKILHHTFLDEYDRRRAGKRDLARQALEADLTGSFAGLDELLAAQQTSPSERAVRNEDLTRLAEALEQLPPDQREVITLKHLVGLTLAQISERLGRSSEAVAGLLFRGRIRLRELLAQE
ncbi:MAG TPA: sigma-70 family RNA polymerase sigma factor [Gemmataceae bacterium]|jgi:RNA polymerase sigma-70 factor (ECF subfamily)